MKLTLNVNSKVVYSKVVSLTDCIELASHLLVVGLRVCSVCSVRWKEEDECIASHASTRHRPTREVLITTPRKGGHVGMNVHNFLHL